MATTTEVDLTATALAGLLLSANTLSRLVEKGVFSEQDAYALLHNIVSQVSPGDAAQKEAVRHALKSVFPQAPI